MELFEALVPLRVEWYGLSTVLIADDLPLLELTARSGCRGLLLGFESLVSENLRGVSKVFNRPKQYSQVVQRLHAHRIAVYGCFVFGFDHDTPDVFLDTAQFAVDAGIDLPRFAISTPFPGTALHHRLAREGRILTKNWELYDGQHVVFQPARMSVTELQEGTERAWRHAYSVPSIARRLRVSPASLGVSVAANVAYRHYARHLHRFYNCDWVIESSRLPAAAVP
jgi:radical SAM superfamily enzyme YgiQ (UPF0313 family)